RRSRREPIANAAAEFNGGWPRGQGTLIEVLSNPPADDIIPASPAAGPGRSARSSLRSATKGGWIMSFRFAAAAVAAIVFVPGSAGAQVLNEKNISVKMAMTIAETALAECGARASVAVVDKTGRLKVFLQGDGAMPHN